MIVKVAPLGERVVEVNVASGSTVGQILDVADVIANDRSIAVSNTPATLDTVVTQEGAIITLAQAMKGGKR